MSLDGYVKILNDEGVVENEILGMGMALNGSIMPSRQDYYLVAIMNEETEENFVCVYRRQKMKRALGPFNQQVLDLKMSALNNMMFIPGENFTLERLELQKDLWITSLLNDLNIIVYTDFYLVISTQIIQKTLKI